MKVSKIKPNPNNPRIIKDERFAKLVQSIKDFPKMMELRPMVINSDNIVLGGNMRLKAITELGMKEIPDSWVKKATDLTEEEARRFIIADNVGFGEHDWEVLANEWNMDELTDWGLDIPDFKPEVLEAEEDDYSIPDEIKTDIVLGDLFEIGEHRLLCGDSTDSDQVAKLMNGEKADMVFTDPPYNVAFNGRSGKFDVIKNDDLPENEFEDLIDGFVSILNILQPRNYYVWCNWKFYGILQSKLDFKACIVWAKNVFGLGRGYRHQHEFCLFNGKLDEGISNESDLWQVKKDTNYLHPTQKPIELASRALNNHKQDKLIVDLFSGSGLTFLASHQLKRKCYGMELDPKYCQVIIDRMKKLDPSIEIKRNGVLWTKTGELQAI
ncbi:COG0863 DNA modification methylase [uncultured Caudovirales phage]|uniref:COG0863 DNA modification methylase n=1 Tax=uncultured Caudovirales phage TaxID=2100421 RepID=A0A6J5QDS4_9CAUD|nr:COG0863 DNA modification methylase [uncultured Caudovirales phage]CAB5229320.1 COG0863 DNA modification methylase [uncultured Caudovirales phage]